MEDNTNNEATLFELDLDRSKAMHMANAGRAQELAMKALSRGDFGMAIAYTEERDRAFAYAEGIGCEVGDLLGW